MSQALERWRTERSGHLDELLEAHRLVAGPSRGRKWRTQQINDALFLRLATEFQGFARELHDLASETFAVWSAMGNSALESTLRLRMTDGRQLDRGNAQPASLGADFSRFGFQLWPALVVRDAAVEAQQASLERLNKARNAIVHDHKADLQVLRTDGFPPTKRVFSVWRRDLEGLAASLDAEVSSQLGNLFTRANPW